MSEAEGEGNRGSVTVARLPARSNTVRAVVDRLQGLALLHEEVVLDELDRIAVKTGTRSSMRGRRLLRHLIRSLGATPLPDRSAHSAHHLDVATTRGKVRKDDDAAIRKLVRTSQRNLDNRDLMLRRIGDIGRGLRATRLGTAAQLALTYAL